MEDGIARFPRRSRPGGSRPVPGSGGHTAAGRVEGNALHRRSLAGCPEDVPEYPRGHVGDVPQPDVAVITGGGQQCAAGMEGDAPDGACASIQGQLERTGNGIPDPRRPSSRHGHVSAVRTELRRRYGPLADQPSALTPRRDLPRADRPVVTASEELAAIRVEA